MTVHLCIDRFEGNRKQIAVLVNDAGEAIEFPRSLLPPNSKAGDVLTLSIEHDPKATQELADETRKVQADLKRTDPGGDIKL